MADASVQLPTLPGNTTVLSRAFSHVVSALTVLSQGFCLVDPATGNALSLLGNALPVTNGLATTPNLVNVTTLGYGTTVSLGGSKSNLGMQVVFTGNPINCTVNLEGSLNGDNWFELAQFVSSSSYSNGDLVFSTNTPVNFIRTNLISLSGGTTPSVSTWLSAT